MLTALLSDASSARAISGKLADMAHAGEVEDALFGTVISLHEDICCAEDGIFGDLSSLRQDLASLLESRAAT